MSLPELDSIGLSIFNKLSADNSATREHARSVLQRFDGADEEQREELFLEWVNGQRTRACKRAATESELSFILPAARTLLEIACKPLLTLPSFDGRFVLTHKVTEAANTDAAPLCDPALNPTPDVDAAFVLYVRTRSYRGIEGIELLRAELVAYGTSYPARLPWVKCVLDELAQPVYALPNAQAHLSYAGQTSEPGKQAVERLIDDLEGDAPNHFQNFCRVAAETRRSLNVPPATWHFYEYVESPACDPIGLRTRLDLQAAEIATIGALLSFALNSAFGGFHHLDHHPQYHPAAPSLLLTTPSLPLPDAQRQDILRHCKDVRRVCNSVPDSGPRISDAAFNAVKRQAADLRAVGNGFTLGITVAKDIPHEELQAQDEECGFFGRNVGPGPAWFLYVRKCCMAALLVLRFSVRWVALVGGFWDFWTIIIVHIHIWLSLLFLIRYIRIARPLFIRVKSAKVCNLFVSGALADVVLQTELTEGTLSRFWACRPTSFLLLRMCVNVKWIIRIWVELVPPKWVWWIGEVVICQVGPTQRDWAIVCLMGRDGRLKYDPSLQVPLARLHTIAHRIAVRTEEIILLRTLSNPPDSDDIKVWLLQCRTEIQAHLTAEGLIAERDAAREEFEANLHARRSQSARQAAQQSRLNDIHAVGDRQSPERRAQFEAIVEATLDREERGVSKLLSPFPRPRGYSEHEWSLWWMSRKSDCNMVQAVKQQDQTNAADAQYDPEASMAVYHQSGLAAWLAANRSSPSGWRGVLTLIDAVESQVDVLHTRTNDRHRVLTCANCYPPQLCSKNGKHLCPQIQNATFTSSLAKGVYTVHLWDVQQVLDHPEVGLGAWKREKLEELRADMDSTNSEAYSSSRGSSVSLEVYKSGDADSDDGAQWDRSESSLNSEGDEAPSAGDIEEIKEEDQEEALKSLVERVWLKELDGRGLAYLPRHALAPILLNMSHRWTWVDPSMIDHVPLPLYKPLAPLAQQRTTIITQLGHSIIRLNPVHSPVQMLPSALDLIIDDTPLWDAKRFERIVRSLSQTSPIYLTVCSQSDPCSYIGASHNSGKQSQHYCVVGKRDVAFGEQFASEFRELPLVWQHRVWCYIREQKGDRVLAEWKVEQS